MINLLSTTHMVASMDGIYLYLWIKPSHEENMGNYTREGFMQMS